MKKKPTKITVVGAGLVGSLASIYLAKRGYQITVFEHRSDMRSHSIEGGRSINLALSNRGLRALDEVGLSAQIRKHAMPLTGRIMHSREGSLTYQPYGMKDQFINSISRGGLNSVLINEAVRLGVDFQFEHRCVNLDLAKSELAFQFQGAIKQHTADLIIGCDGAFSSIRHSMQFTDRFEFTQHYIDHGYKELRIPAGKNGIFMMEKEALHIWPRESFMMIALPNTDATFTCTLFFPFDGENSFSHLRSPESINSFFSHTFPDVLPLMPTLIKDFHENPVSSLVTIHCYPWVKNNTLLLGDAAHGIVPFYGQGMNAGFEDCRILNQFLDHWDDQWDLALPEFQNQRKPDTDAIAQLAMDNFVEMRDLVADAEFLLRKKIEAKLNEQFPEKWIPLYSMVTFHDNIRYSDALAVGKKQKEIMDAVMKTPGLANNWESLDFEAIVNKLDSGR